MKAKRQCAIYTRTSTEEGLAQDFNSLHAQAEACTAFIKSQASEGWIAARRIYEDGGYSGGSIERPALRELLDDIAAGRVDVGAHWRTRRHRLSRSGRRAISATRRSSIESSFSHHPASKPSLRCWKTSSAPNRVQASRSSSPPIPKNCPPACKWCRWTSPLMESDTASFLTSSFRRRSKLGNQSLCSAFTTISRNAR